MFVHILVSLCVCFFRVSGFKFNRDIPGFKLNEPFGNHLGTSGYICFFVICFRQRNNLGCQNSRAAY